MRKLVDCLAELARRKYFRFGLVAVLVVGVALAAARPALAAGSADWSVIFLTEIADLALALAGVIGKLVVAVLGVVIPVMQYQGFTTSQVVVAGWAIVRDVVNMFFVVVLIIIAMGTIFGHSKFQWKQQVPKLMIFALVINFSKTLCGLMIDFAQVIMITFANALKDIAGGNFIQLLGLSDIVTLSSQSQTIAGATNTASPGTTAFDLFAAGLAAVLMMVWVLAVVVILLFILVYRVVMLWILIVLAPLAWFMGGQSVFKSDAYAEWWKNFICYTAIGPVITFFLWLTLAVAGSGFIAASDPGLSSVAPAGDLNSNGADFVTKIFEWQRLTSFVVGMAMLMAGFDAASKICSGVKGPGFQKLLSAGQGVPGAIGGYLGGAARKYGGKGLAAGYTGGKSLVRGTGVAALTAVAGGGTAAERVERLKPTRAGQAARAGGLRSIAGALPIPFARAARAAAKGADERQQDLADSMKKAAEEEYKGSSDATKIEVLKRMASPGGELAFENAANKGLLLDAIKDTKMRDKLSKEILKDKKGNNRKDSKGQDLSVLSQLASQFVPDLKKEVKGTKEYDTIKALEAGRPDLFRYDDDGNDRIAALTAEDLSEVDAEAYKDLDVQDQLRTIDSDIVKSTDKNTGVVTYFNEYETAWNGKRGQKKKKAIKSTGTPPLGGAGGGGGGGGGGAGGGGGGGGGPRRGGGGPRRGGGGGPTPGGPTPGGPTGGAGGGPTPGGPIPPVPPRPRAPSPRPRPAPTGPTPGGPTGGPTVPPTGSPVRGGPTPGGSTGGSTP